MKFCLANEAHDEALRRLVREQPMPGWVRLAFTCEPNWADAQAPLGDVTQTLVGTHDDGTVVGCGVRAIRRVYLNGKEASIGYLSGLRSAPEARSSFGLVHGFRFLRQLHQGDGLVPSYLSTIIESNRPAIELLTSGRAGLPAYTDRGRILTSAIFFRRRRRTKSLPVGVTIRKGDELPVKDIVRFLRDEGARRQFFPVVVAEELGTERWRGLKLADFRVVQREGSIVGLAAAWDQTAFRQTVVTSYAPPLGAALPACNLLLRLVGRKPLPSRGGVLPFFHMALTCIRDDDPEIFAMLLKRFHDDWSGRSYSCFVVSLHEGSPLRAALETFSPLQYASRLYQVNWREDRLPLGSWDAGAPHIESGLL